MLGLDGHGDTGRLDDVTDGIGDLHRQVFLDLQASCIHVDDTGDFRQPDHLAARQIGDVRATDEWQHVMLAQRVQFDVLDDDHVVVLRAEYGVIHYRVKVLIVAAAQECHRLRRAFRCLDQPLALQILSQALDDSGVVSLDMVNLHVVPVADTAAACSSPLL